MIKLNATRTIALILTILVLAIEINVVKSKSHKNHKTKQIGSKRDFSGQQTCDPKTVCGECSYEYPYCVDCSSFCFQPNKTNTFSECVMSDVNYNSTIATLLFSIGDSTQIYYINPKDRSTGIVEQNIIAFIQTEPSINTNDTVEYYINSIVYADESNLYVLCSTNQTDMPTYLLKGKLTKQFYVSININNVAQSDSSQQYRVIANNFTIIYSFVNDTSSLPYKIAAHKNLMSNMPSFCYYNETSSTVVHIDHMGNISLVSGSSSNEIRGIGIGLDNITNMCISRDGSWLYAINNYFKNILQINMVTGDRTILSGVVNDTSNDIAGIGPNFINPSNIIYAHTKMLYVLDIFSKNIFAVNTTSGDRTIAYNISLDSNITCLSSNNYFIEYAPLKLLVYINCYTSTNTEYLRSVYMIDLLNKSIAVYSGNISINEYGLNVNTTMASMAVMKGKMADGCGVCEGDGSSCYGCDILRQKGLQPDTCGVCGGNNQSCADCLGIPYGNTAVDACGVCNGNNDTCLDCLGVINGVSTVDQCGVCGGNGYSCRDCMGVVNGSSSIRGLCGLCMFPNTFSEDCLDCSQSPNNFEGEIFYAKTLDYEFSNNIVEALANYSKGAIYTKSVIKSINTTDPVFFDVSLLFNTTFANIDSVLQILPFSITKEPQAQHEFVMLVRYINTTQSLINFAYNESSPGLYSTSYNLISSNDRGSGFSLDNISMIQPMTDGIINITDFVALYFGEENDTDSVVYGVDVVSNTIILINLVSGDRQLVTANDYGGGPPFNNLFTLISKWNSTDLYAYDSGIPALMSIDATRSNRGIISSYINYHRGNGPALPNDPTACLFTYGDIIQKYLYLFRQSLSVGMYQIDISTGNRVVIPYNTHLSNIDLDSSQGQIIDVKPYSNRTFYVIIQKLSGLQKGVFIDVYTGIAYKSNFKYSNVRWVNLYKGGSFMRKYAIDACGMCTNKATTCENDQRFMTTSTSSATPSVSVTLSQSGSVSRSYQISDSSTKSLSRSSTKSLSTSSTRTTSVSTSTSKSRSTSPGFAPPQNSLSDSVSSDTSDSEDINNSTEVLDSNGDVCLTKNVDYCGVCGGFNITCPVPCISHNNCSGNGLCRFGNCFCGAKHYGLDCSESSPGFRIANTTNSISSRNILPKKNAKSIKPPHQKIKSTNTKKDENTQYTCDNDDSCIDMGFSNGVHCVDNRCLCINDNSNDICYSDKYGTVNEDKRKNIELVTTGSRNIPPGYKLNGDQGNIVKVYSVPKDYDAQDTSTEVDPQSSSTNSVKKSKTYQTTALETLTRYIYPSQKNPYKLYREATFINSMIKNGQSIDKDWESPIPEDYTDSRFSSLLTKFQNLSIASVVSETNNKSGLWSLLYDTKAIATYKFPEKNNMYISEHKRQPIQQDQDQCIPTSCCGVNCNNGGICVDGICLCAPGYDGEYCEIVYPNSNDCGSDCVQLEPYFPPCMVPICNRLSGDCLAAPRAVGYICTDDSSSSCDLISTCDGQGNCVVRKTAPFCGNTAYVTVSIVLLVLVACVISIFLVSSWFLKRVKTKRRRNH